MYRVPQMADYQSKKTMIETLKSQSSKAYKKTKLKNLPISIEDTKQIEENLNSAEMDIDDGNGNLITFKIKIY